MKLDVQPHTLALSGCHHDARGAVRERELLIVAITDADGLTGYGEAAPLPGYDGVQREQVLLALGRYARVLAGAEFERSSGAEILDGCRAAADLPQALAAIDLALWDLAGRRRGVPVASLLSDDPLAAVPVNATIAVFDRAGVSERALAAARAGFGCVKLKVGLGDDAGRVAAARAALGPEVALRLDANGAWNVEQAVAAIGALAPAGLELVEEPVHGLAQIRELRERVSVRVSIDETAAEPGALAAGVADAVCLKIGRCGGIAGLLAAASLVRAGGGEVYLASTLDGPLGVAAALHAAAALGSRGPLPHCGLATLGLFAGLRDPLPPRAGEIELPAAPGLGVEPF